MISLLIPFASRNQRRVAIFYWVQSRWAHLFPEFELCVGLSEEKDFNRSEARNRAFAQSRGDILVLTDADTCCPAENVRAAIEQVRCGAPWVVAHDRYYSLTRDYTDGLLAQKPAAPLVPPFECDWVMKQRSMAGVLVIPRVAWEHVNGYDERFQLWGYEDTAFAVKMDNLWGEHERTPGPMLHLWHPRGEGEHVADFSQPNIEHNRKLYEEIRRETQRR